MKEYFFQNKNSFINRGFNKIKNFEFLTSFTLYELLLEQEKNIYNLKEQEYHTITEQVDVEQGWLKKFNLKRNVCRLRVNTDCITSLENKFTYRIKNEGKPIIESDIFREDTIRSIYSPSLFLYLNIPHEFLLENLYTNLDNVDLSIFYKEFKNVDLDSFRKIIEAVERLDKRYPVKYIAPGQTTPKTEDFYTWRAGIMFNMLYSIHKVGFAYPLINTSTSSLFFDGTHRLSICPIVEKDYPIFLRIPAVDFNEIFYYITPTIFSMNRSCLLIIDTKLKEVKGKLVNREQLTKFTNIDLKNQTIRNLEIINYSELNKFIKYTIKENFDFKWK